jgi:hypothetical protein
MTDIETICPICEKDITIKARDIKLAVQHIKETNNKLLVGCPECCRVLLIPEKLPEGGYLDEWIATIAENDDWCGCVPLLDPTQAKIPNGSYSDLGVTMYRPGSGGAPMRKRAYMLLYGIDPECHLAKNPSMGGKPKDLGKKAKK